MDNFPVNGYLLLGISGLCRCELVRRINDEMTGSSQN